MSPRPLSASRGGSARPAGRRLLSLGLWIGLSCLTLVALAVAIAATAPVSLITRFAELPPQVRMVQGTLRQGRAVLRGGYAVEWAARPAFTPWPGIAADWTLRGADTLLSGRAEASPAGARIADAGGRAGPGLLRLAPAAPDCSMAATVRDLGLSYSWLSESAGGRGSVATPAGVCTRVGREAPLPPLAAELGTEGDAVLLTLADDAGTALGRVRVSGQRRFALRVEQAGARLVPGLPSGAPIEIDMPF